VASLLQAGPAGRILPRCLTASVIRRSTVFILGAGTSKPYGFSTGEQLLREGRRLDQNNLFRKLHAPASNDAARALHTSLQRTHDSSLDALLELRPDITPIGKRLIASLMLELEFHAKDPGRYPEPQDDWLTLFFDELAADTADLEGFALNPVTLITYNYDRLLELRLLGALAAH